MTERSTRKAFKHCSKNISHTTMTPSFPPVTKPWRRNSIHVTKCSFHMFLNNFRGQQDLPKTTRLDCGIVEQLCVQIVRFEVETIKPLGTFSLQDAFKKLRWSYLEMKCRLPKTWTFRQFTYFKHYTHQKCKISCSLSTRITYTIKKSTRKSVYKTIKQAIWFS